MAVGSWQFPNMPAIAGVELVSAACGIKSNQRQDLVIIALPETASTAGVFTQNAFCAAPVEVCREHLSETTNSRYFVINSGNANACTGDDGLRAAKLTCEKLAHLSSINPNQVLPFSTGVIGEPLPVDKIITALKPTLANLSDTHWHHAAQGIMTTDTQPKGASVSFVYKGETIIVNGIAKGAGMIRPNMATMLAYIVTNAAVDTALLKLLSLEAANLSFNRITIDGDTSTNDSCLLTSAPVLNAELVDTEAHPMWEPLRAAVIQVHQTLAKAIVRDGEGATKFVTLDVSGGANPQECLDVAYAIAHSPLVKTAFFASDPNWGRIVAAIGYAGVENLDASRVNLYLDDVAIVTDGQRSATYTEAQGQAVMNQSDITIRVELGRGSARQALWTSDLSHEYVTINAEYRSQFELILAAMLFITSFT